MKKRATIYRMATPWHLCPWGVKGKDLLRRKGFEVEDHLLASMEEDRRFKGEKNVDETPQVWIEGEHIGGYDALRERLGLGPDPKEGETYRPVLVIFGVALALALAIAWRGADAMNPIRVIETFVALTMCLLGVQKLRDPQSFANGFVQYDLLAQRYVPYAVIYALIETVGGTLMIAGVLTE